MQELDCTNIGTWARDLEGQVFRYTVYKKVWTPYELEKKYSDESEYEDGGYYNHAYITNIIEIPNDVLIEFEELAEYEEGAPFEPKGYKTYRKLSEISLSKFDIDNEERIPIERYEEDQYLGEQE